MTAAEKRAYNAWYYRHVTKPRRASGQPAKRRAVSVGRLRALLDSGLTQGQAAAALGCSRATVVRLVGQHGFGRPRRAKVAIPCTWQDCGEAADVAIKIADTRGLPYCAEHASAVRRLFVVTGEHAAGWDRGSVICSALTRRSEPCQRVAVRDGRCPSHPLESWRVEAAA